LDPRHVTWALTGLAIQDLAVALIALEQASTLDDVPTLDI
jgi:hypothetical protein